MAGNPFKVAIEIGGKVGASLGQSIAQAQRQVSGLGANVARSMNASAAATKRSFKDVFNSAAWQQAAIGATAVVGALGLAVKAAADFDSSMADVRKAIDFKDGIKGAQRFGNELVKLSTEIPYTAKELASIAAAAGFAGYKESEIPAFIRDAAKMGVAFQMTAEASGELMVALRAGMNLSQVEVMKLGDSINYLSDQFQGTVNAVDLAEVTKRIGAIGLASGLAADQVAGLGAAFLASGTPTEVAATGLKNFLKAMTIGTAATKHQREALSEVFGSAGKDISVQLAQEMQDAPEKAIRSVIEGIAKLPAAVRPGVVTRLFGEESKAAIMPLLTNVKLLEQAFGLIKNPEVSGSMMKEFDNQMKTTGAQFKTFKNQLNAIGISVGTVLLPVLNSLMKALAPVLKAAVGWTQKHPKITQGIILVTAAFAGLIIALPILAAIITSFGIVTTAIAGAIPIIAGVGTVIAVLTTGPIAAVGAAIIGVGLIFKALYDKVPWFRDIVNSAFSEAGKIIESWGDTCREVSHHVLAIFRGDVGAIKDAFLGYLKWMESIFTPSMGELGAKAGDSFASNLIGRVTAALKTANEAVNALGMLNPAGALRGALGVAAGGGGGLASLSGADAQGRTAQLSSSAAAAFERMRKASGGIVKTSDIASAYRSPEQNRAVKGVQGSKHLTGTAMDIHGASGDWIRKNGAAYGWKPNDYPGSHGGHYEFVGPGRAFGGSVIRNSSFLVGERRPEVFTPSQSGQILPDLSAMTKPQGSKRSRKEIALNVGGITINGASGDLPGIQRAIQDALNQLRQDLNSQHRLLLND